MDWVVVTSCIVSPYDNVDIDQRFSQTQDTVSSLRTKLPGCKIVLLETSPRGLAQYQDAMSQSVDHVWSVCNEPVIQELHQEHRGNVSAIKSPSESWAMHHLLKHQDFFSPQDRVYKISGRYQLSDAFDSRQHQTHSLVVARKKSPVTYYHRDSGQHMIQVSPAQYPTRLYSFAGTMAQTMSYVMQHIYQQLVTMYRHGQFTDIEHLFYLYVQGFDPVEIDPVGVQGMQADSREWLQE